MDRLKKMRTILKAWCEENELNSPADQQKGLPQPPLEKWADARGEMIELPEPADFIPIKGDVVACIRDRVSQRKFLDKSMSIEQLSFLLWATQGVKSVSKNNYFFKKTVPSAGSRHPFETYLAVMNVESIEPGIYGYVSSKHSLVLIEKRTDLHDRLIEVTSGQKFCGEGGVMFIWTAIPYRTEWRYSNHAMKAILLDAGHLGQNLYLACEAAGLGTCGIGAYFQELADSLIGVDGLDELTVYMAPVGFPEFSDSSNRIS